MANFIEELYYGNIDPQARGYRPKSPVKKVSDSLNSRRKNSRNSSPARTRNCFSVSVMPTPSSLANASWTPSSPASASALGL